MCLDGKNVFPFHKKLLVRFEINQLWIPSVVNSR